MLQGVDKIFHEGVVGRYWVASLNQGLMHYHLAIRNILMNHMYEGSEEWHWLGQSHCNGSTWGREGGENEVVLEMQVGMSDSIEGGKYGRSNVTGVAS
jgi:hypothetical protein